MTTPASNQPASREDLFALLTSLQIETRTVDHPAVFTVEESLAIHKHDLLPGGHSKNLFLKDKKGRVYLVVALHDAAIDMKTLHKLIGSDRLSFGKPELLVQLLGIQPGSVTPFALINDRRGEVTVILDAAMMEHDLLNYHPLSNTATTNIARDDLLRFIRATKHEPKIVAVSAGAAMPGDPVTGAMDGNRGTVGAK